MRQSRHNQFFEHGDMAIGYLSELAKVGWTQRRIAAALGVNKQHVNKALRRYGIEHITRTGPRVPLLGGPVEWQKR